MKRKIAWIGAILSALYLLTLGIFIPDPLPFIDEAMALGIFLKCTTMLGFDLRNLVPFLSKKGKGKASPKSKDEKEVTIDV